VSTQDTDILVVGAGVIGLSIARALAARGAGRVTVVDRGKAGAEASWAAAGMLAPNAETHEDGALFRLCTASNALYPKYAAQLLEETGIDVELDTTGTLSLSFDETGDRLISEKFDWQKGAGIEVERLSAKEVLKLEPGISADVRSGLFYPNDWQVENRKLVAALRRSCQLGGIRILEHSEVSELLRADDRVHGLRTSSGEIRAAVVVVANGAWASQLLGKSIVRPVRGQMIGLKGGERVLNAVVYGPGGYLVPRKDGRVLVGATVEDVGFRKEVTGDAVEALRDAALEIAPVLGNFDIKEAWAGLRPYAADGLPVIGRVPWNEGLFVATGHYRNGILLAPITAELVADAVLGGGHSEYLEEFGPERFFSGSAASNRV
jgi:glycine oxidase